LSQESRYSKMEKADILEMTVAHLKFVHSARRSYIGDHHGRAGCHAAELPSASDEASGGAAALRYLMGYNECVREVASYFAGDSSDTGRLGDDVRTALMRHLDESLRVRAAAPVVAVTRLPSPCSRLDADQRMGASSPLAVDAAASTPWRHRCDSGVYSGASSPAQDDELAGASLPSPLELTTRTKNDAVTTLFDGDVDQLPQTLDVSQSSDVWRPW